jgi:hypothetical protein
VDATRADLAARPRRFPILPYVIALLFIALFALAPIASLMISIAIADANGCTLNEGGVHPCVVGGHDWGETLMTMFVLGWLMLLTLPIGAIAFVIWCAALITHLLIRRSKRAAAVAATALCFCFAIRESAAESAPAAQRSALAVNRVRIAASCCR